MKAVASAIFFLLLTVGYAQADWQFTKWGMSPDEVIAGSSRIAPAVQMSAQDGAQKSRGPNRALLEGDYTAGDFNFRATYLFAGNKLSEVDLELTDRSKGNDLARAMGDKYGKPIREALGGGEWVSGADHITLYYLGHWILSYFPSPLGAAAGGL